MITEWLTRQWWSSKVSIPSLILSPLSFLYQFLSSLRRTAYSRNILSRHSVDVPVIVVGNIIVGGSGKTPVVISIVQHFLQKGKKVAVLSRGYGVQISGLQSLVISNVSSKSADQKFPDEPLLIHSVTGASVYCHPSRVLAAKQAVEEGAELLVCDDGLQHYALARDIEIVIHPKQPSIGNGLHMPAGPLREGLSRAREAQYQLSTDSLPNHVFGEVYQYQFVPKHFVNLLTNQTLPITEFKKARVVAFAGIAKPTNFFNTLTDLHIELAEVVHYDDHHKYTEVDIQQLIGLCQQHNTSLPESSVVLMMTQKDAVKCLAILRQMGCSQHPVEFWVLEMSACLPESFLSSLDSSVMSL